MDTTPDARLARLETHLEYLRAADERQSARLDALDARLAAVHDAITGAKAGWRVIGIVGSLAGAAGGWLAGHLGVIRIGAVLLALATLAGTPSPAHAAAYLAAAGRAEPTAAYVGWCRRAPAECRVDRREPAVLYDTPWLRATLAAVSAFVNDHVRQVSDQAHWGVADRWDFPDDGAGDCEDLQVEKRRRLVALGLPRRALRMAIVIDEEGEGHAVLLALTDRGGLVLDNKRGEILAPEATGYTWLKRESAAGPGWLRLRVRTRDPPATAAR